VIEIEPETETDTPYAVLKFGGTSVSTARRWGRIGATVRSMVQAGSHPVLVCSALSGITDALEGLVASIERGEAPERALGELEERHARLGATLGIDSEAILAESFAALRAECAIGAHEAARSDTWRARVISSGERLSTKLGAAWLASQGIAARWVDARTLLRALPEERHHLSACCGHAPDASLQRRLREAGAEVTITQGFVASNAEGETVLLGRGGSDTSAAYLASILEAQRLEIWTDVPGLFTLDPRRCPGARLLPHASYDEAAVLAGLGAKILHPRCLPPLSAGGIPLRIRWTDRPELEGTLIGAPSDRRPAAVRAVTSRSGLCLVRMRRDRSWQPVGFMAEVSRCFHARGLSMDLISSSPSEIRATIDLPAQPGAEALLPLLLEDLSEFCAPSLHLGLGCVSVVGSRVDARIEPMARALEQLGRPALHLISHAADDTHTSYVIDASIVEPLAAALHETLFGADAVREALGPSWSELQEAIRSDRRLRGQAPLSPPFGAAAVSA